MSGRRAKALRRQVYGTDYSPKRSARGTKTVVVFARASFTITCDDRRTAYQHAKRDWKAQGCPSPSPLRREPRRGTMPFWNTDAQRKKAWHKKT